MSERPKIQAVPPAAPPSAPTTPAPDASTATASAPLWRLLILGVTALAAVYVGFLLFTPKQAEKIIHDFGYAILSGTFVAWLALLWACRREDRAAASLVEDPSANMADRYRAASETGEGSFKRQGGSRENAREGADHETRGEQREGGCGEEKGGGRWSGVGAAWIRWRRRPNPWPALAIAGMTLLCVIAEAPRFKVLYDEFVLQATAMHIHLTREISTTVRAYEINGVFVPIENYLDKRPYFFAYLLSLVHDLTGWRPGNVFVLNGLLTAAFLTLLWLYVRRLAGALGGLLAVILMGSLPLLAQNTTGSGMEVLNLSMIVTAMLLGTRALEKPTTARIGAFLFGIVLLAQSRYESTLYALPAALVMALIWWRERRLLLPWPVLVAPLLFLPCAWHNIVLSGNKVLWELPDDLDRRFDPVHVAGNLTRAARFLFSTAQEHPNSIYVSVVGVFGLLVCLVLWLRRPFAPLQRPARSIALVFSIAICGNLGLLMFYFWGGLDDPLVSRLSLPLHVLFAAAGAVALSWLDRWKPATRWALAGALASIPLIYGRTTQQHLYTSFNLLAHELTWEREVLSRRTPGPRLVITNKSCLPWLAQGTASVLIDRGRERAEQIRFHMEAGSFVEVLVTQRLRATTPNGDFELEPEYRLPPRFHLETLAERRFGPNVARISKLVRLDPPPDKRP